MVIFRDPVSGLQFFGYGIALAGLVYYKLGADKLKEYAAEGSRQWSDYGNRSPIMRKLLTIGLVITTVIILLGGVGSMFPEYGQQAADKFNDLLRNDGQHMHNSGS